MPSCCGNWASRREVSVEALVARYGLAGVFLGAGLEGEAAVVASGLLAHHGLFPLVGAMAAAAAGSFVADQIWFFVGRRFHDHRWVKKARAKPAFARAVDIFHRHPTGFIFAFRFIYGFRTVSPIAIGTTDVSAKLFVAVNLVSAIVWGIAFTTIGYVFGHGFERFVGRIVPDTRTLILGAVGVIAVIGIVVFVRWRRTA